MDTAGQTPTGQHTAGLMGSTRASEAEEQELTRRAAVPPENTTSWVYSTTTDSNLWVGPGSSESLSWQLLHTSSSTLDMLNFALPLEGRGDTATPVHPSGRQSSEPRNRFGS
eukprot:898326-Rhodomonas_salina.1